MNGSFNGIHIYSKGICMLDHQYARRQSHRWYLENKRTCKTSTQSITSINYRSQKIFYTIRKPHVSANITDQFMCIIAFNMLSYYKCHVKYATVHSTILVTYSWANVRTTFIINTPKSIQFQSVTRINKHSHVRTRQFRCVKYFLL